MSFEERFELLEQSGGDQIDIAAVAVSVDECDDDGRHTLSDASVFVHRCAFRSRRTTAAPRRPRRRRRIGSDQMATMPSPPAAFATVTLPIAVSVPFALTRNASTIPLAPVCT